MLQVVDKLVNKGFVRVITQLTLIWSMNCHIGIHGYGLRGVERSNIFGTVYLCDWLHSTYSIGETYGLGDGKYCDWNPDKWLDLLI